MFDEAEASLTLILESEAAAYLAAQNALLQICIARSENERAADLGTSLILEGVYDAKTIILTMAALSYCFSAFFGAGRYSLVCFPALAALAGTALTGESGVGDTDRSKES